MNENEIFRLCDIVRETSFALHKYLRHGLAEKVYENGLKNRLSKIGINVAQQLPLTVRDEDGTNLGEYITDLFIENEIIIELKAVKALNNDHVAQLLGYLRASNTEHGLLINFGAPKLEIKKYILSKL